MENITVKKAKGNKKIPAIVESGAGRPAYQPTDFVRNQVFEMAKLYLSEDDIARLIGVDPVTLRKHFRHELTQGKIEQKKETLGKFFTGIKNNDPNLIKFFLKTQCGWSETLNLNIQHPNIETKVITNEKEQKIIEEAEFRILKELESNVTDSDDDD